MAYLIRTYSLSPDTTKLLEMIARDIAEGNTSFALRQLIREKAVLMGYNVKPVLDAPNNTHKKKTRKPQVNASARPSN